MSQHFDTIVIGGGPGGYVSAIKASQLNFRVALVDAREHLGGTCLHVGCIPSKALLDSSEHFHLAKNTFSDHGILIDNISLDFKKMMARKDNVVSTTASGIDYLIKKNKITHFRGQGSFIDDYTIQVTKDGNSQCISADHIVIATGSRPIALPFAPFDNDRVISSTEALELSKIPEHLLIIGGGFIGLEIGSVYGRLGSKITVIEASDAIIPSLDRELGKSLQRSLRKINVSFHLNTMVTSVNTAKNRVEIIGTHKGKEQPFSGDYLLIAIGRHPYTEGLNLKAAGVSLDKKGFIKTNNRFQTDCEHIYAIGDVIAAGPMLAHKAEEEGVAVAEIIARKKVDFDYALIPGVVYTSPEVASVGKSEEQLCEEGVEYNVGKFPFKASGRARAANETEGFIKVLSAKTSDIILGVHMIGPRCSDMIAEAVLAMYYTASSQDIASIPHAHPSFTEAFKEASLMAMANRSLHI